MIRPRRKVLVADLLCGAGGSSTGCQRACDELGLEMELVAVNHWPTAIATHSLNHPKARHYVQDISTVRPHILVPEGYLDLLMASPTCTHHSVARGGKPTSDQQRSDPWHIITWLTELRVKRIIIENVWEFIKWGPVDPVTMKPIKDREGEYFNAWIDTVRRIGFEDLDWRKLNAANYGDATTRSRFIMKGYSYRRQVGWAPLTHAKRPADGVALVPSLQPWRPAREIIDWNIRGRSIFNRKKDLAPKTLARIWAGAIKHGWPRPFLVILRNHMASQGLDVPIPTIAAQGFHIGLAEPVIVNMKGRSTASGADEPLPTQTAHAGHLATAEAVIVRTNMHGRKSPGARGAQDPLMTITTDGGIAVAEPIILSQHSSGAARSVEEPLPTIMTGGAGAGDHPGCARPMLIEPFIANLAHGNSPGDRTADQRRTFSIDDPLGAIHAGGGAFGIVEPFILSQASGGAPREIGEPLPTIPTGGAHALITPYYSNGWQEQSGAAPPVYTTEQPLPPITTKGRFGMVVPVTHSQGANQARDVAEPLPTMTTAKGGEFAIVMPVTHHDASDRVQDVGQPLPTITGANRGELAFITAQHGERPGQAPRTHDLDNPTPVIAATGHVDLVQGILVDGVRYDILFRMLEPHELAAAMGLGTRERPYIFAGTKTEQVKQIGNAVAGEMIKAECKEIFADAVPRRRRKPRPAVITIAEAA